MCCLRHSNIDDCSGVACREEKLTTAAFFLSFTAFALPVQVLEAYCSNSRGLITIMYGHTYMECTTGLCARVQSLILLLYLVRVCV